MCCSVITFARDQSASETDVRDMRYVLRGCLRFCLVIASRSDVSGVQPMIFAICSVGLFFWCYLVPYNW